MDTPIKKKAITIKRVLAALAVAGLFVLAGAVVFAGSGGQRLRVKSKNLVISTVAIGPFREYIPVDGSVLPAHTVYIDARESGRVEELFVEDGAILKQGDPILRLGNTDLRIDLMNRETALFDLLNNLQNTRITIEQNRITLQNRLADVSFALLEAERLYKLNKNLFDNKVISEQEFFQAKNNYEYQLKKKKLTEQTIHQDSVTTILQIKQMEESVVRLRGNLELMREKTGDLLVKAPLSGRLSGLPVEIGEALNRGQRLGQMDADAGFKVRASIDEHYITRVFPDLEGSYESNGELYTLRVKKIFSQVSGGRFQADLELTGKVPGNLHRGQSLPIKLALSEKSTALLIPRGGYEQSTGGYHVFKIDDDGIARPVSIKLGRQNPDYVEIKEGLKPGDKVITSSYSTFGNAAELVLE
ncbi:MAG: HlyD family efflux transporter periplasmic adaptor subunit [Bacteroidota bacterium]